MKLKEIVYMILDELKIHSDDSYYTEDHIIFLIQKYRASILEQKYKKDNSKPSDANFQTLCLDLIEVPAVPNVPCEGNVLYLRSKKKIPEILDLAVPMVYPIDFYQGEITLISKERMKYVGYNRFLQNIIYCSIGPDDYLYFTSSNPQFLYLEKVKFTAIFEDPIKAEELACDSSEEECLDIMDKDFPIEESIVPMVIQTALKELLGVLYQPKDNYNNSSDDFSNHPVTNNTESK